MKRKIQEFRREAQLSFQQANHHRSYGHPETARKLAALDVRAALLKERLRKHCRRHEEQWIARQAVTLWRKRFALVAKYPRPRDALSELYPELVMEDARRIVRTRAGWRLSRINRIRARMENSILCKRVAVMRAKPVLVRMEFKKRVTRRLRQ